MGLAGFNDNSDGSEYVNGTWFCNGTTTPTTAEIMDAMRKAREICDAMPPPIIPGMSFDLPVQIVSSEYVAKEETTRKQVRFPRSKRARVRKKWRKDLRNYETVTTTPVYAMGGRLIMHPETEVVFRKRASVLQAAHLFA